MGEEHLTVEREVETLIDRVVCTEVWQGSYDDCKAKQKNYMPGRAASCQDISDVWPSAAKPQPSVFCASAKTRRTPGNRGVCTIVYQALFNTATFGFECAELSKPIESWKADDEEDAPKLDQIEQWKKQKEDNYAAYEGYLYDGSTKMDGNTLTLAEMIFKGIESYTEYVPVMTQTYTQAPMPSAAPAGAPNMGTQLGKRCTPEVPSGCTPIDGVDTLPTHLKNVWIGTGDRLTGNNDGTYTRVQQWTGFDSVDEDLYPEEDS